MEYLNSQNFPITEDSKNNDLDAKLENILKNDLKTDLYSMLAGYKQTLANNNKKPAWDETNEKLDILFKCGKAVVLDGPMIGVSMSIRDSDYFRKAAKLFDQKRSEIAKIEWMATAWNLTFVDTGLWMGKTFEPASKSTVAKKCENHQDFMDGYNEKSTRIGRNFFREPTAAGPMKALSLQTLTSLWKLKDRPTSESDSMFDGILLPENLDKEKIIPYSKTGGVFLADMGESVLSDMNDKKVYQLNYRWPGLNPPYPMSRLVDEVVQIGEGIYLGQLLLATRRYSLGSLRTPFNPNMPEISVGEPYFPRRKSFLSEIWRRLSRGEEIPADIYGYQNNGYFLMLDPAYSNRIYDDDVFPKLRPRKGENGYIELGFDTLETAKAVAESSQAPSISGKITEINWIDGWKSSEELTHKFTTFITEPSPYEGDLEDVRGMLREGESILQMLQRISAEISLQTKYDDHLKHFEQLNRLFRAGIAPRVSNGLFLGNGKRGFNTRVNGDPNGQWYGQPNPTIGFDYYHGAALNLHLGFEDRFLPQVEMKFEDCRIFPSFLSEQLSELFALAKEAKLPNILDITWRNIGKYIFPWAGKSFEKINGRKLSMLLDESQDLAQRYPERTEELASRLAGFPHYDLLLKNQVADWKGIGPYDARLSGGAWDKGMSEEDKSFWEKEAEERWVFGTNTQDSRILAVDSLMRGVDMNYRVPDRELQEISESGPSPFARQGYIFLGTSGRESILPMNNGFDKKKTVFQFNYRTPMIGGPAPIGYCLDELVEIADGLFLGQLIYSTALHEHYHSSIDASVYKYQLFGYFLLMDDVWQSHRKAIKLDTVVG